MSHFEEILTSDAKRVADILSKVSEGGPNQNALYVPLVTEFLRELKIQDSSFHHFGGVLTQQSFNRHRVYVLSIGRQQGTLAKAHMVIGEDTLVFAHPDHFDAMITLPLQNPGTTANFDGLFEETKKAHVVANATTFIEELKSGKYTQAVVYGTDCFQGYLDRGLTELRELAFENLVGDLPRLYVLN